MLELDGAALDLDTVDLTYKLPAPFGPKRGAAVLKIKARPSIAQNPELKAALDKLSSDFRKRQFIREKKFERTRDEEDYIASDEADAVAIERKINELHYDHCVVEWSTTIQNKGKDLPATRDNFIALAEFPHKAVTRAIESFREDLRDYAKWQTEAEIEDDATELGN